MGTVDDRAVAAFAGSLLTRAAGLRLPALFDRSRTDAVWQVHDRNGVSVVVLRTGSLTEDELTGLLRYRLAQYLAAGFADARTLFDSGLEHEPLSSVRSDDYHVLAGTADEGELLCYTAIRGVRPAWHGQRLRSRVRKPFPVEEMHGIGIYDRLAHLPDLPVAKIREIGRFVKNQRLHTFDELGVRAPVEVLLALIQALVGPMRSEVEALVGELEEGVVKRNLDFFHAPTVVLRGTVPYEGQSYLSGHLGRTFYPFAISIADFVAHAMPRTDAIETALALPGREGVLALLSLRRDAAPVRSKFEPRGGLPPLADVEVPHADLPMPVRKEMRRAGELLRQVHPFDQLTAGEATVLRTFMARRRHPEGDQIIREGERGDSLFVAEEGEAELLTTGEDGTVRSLGKLGPGRCFGEIAVVLGLARTASVVARTPMTLLQLSADAYRRYLATIREVDLGFVTTAVNRLART